MPISTTKHGCTNSTFSVICIISKVNGWMKQALQADKIKGYHQKIRFTQHRSPSQLIRSERRWYFTHPLENTLYSAQVTIPANTFWSEVIFHSPPDFRGFFFGVLASFFLKSAVWRGGIPLPPRPVFADGTGVDEAFTLHALRLSCTIACPVFMVCELFCRHFFAVSTLLFTPFRNCGVEANVIVRSRPVCATNAQVWNIVSENIVRETLTILQRGSYYSDWHTLKYTPQ
jgi:hypothetical protein